MGYIVNEKSTLLVGKQKVAGGRTIPSALAKEIGKEGIESLLKDGMIREKDEKKKAKKMPDLPDGVTAADEVDKAEESDLESLTRDELFQAAEKLGIDLPNRSSKADLIDAIREAQ